MAKMICQLFGCTLHPRPDLEEYHCIFCGETDPALWYMPVPWRGPKAWWRRQTPRKLKT
jgi:hypothetical protein